MATTSLPSVEPAPTRPVTVDDTLPDASLFWRWVAKATRPVVGWVLVGLGALFILFGWIGISGEALVAKQMPFLISGGLGGMLLVGIGAVFLATEDMRRDSGRLDRLEAMVNELHAVLLSRPDAPDLDAAAAAANRAEGQNGQVQLMALPQGQTFHRPDCVMLNGKSQARPVTQKVVDERGLKPCRLCEPTAA